MTNFRPVVLCGGSGKRLWPLSRESYPKQFSNIMDENETMLQATVRRVAAAGGRKPVLLSGNEYRFLVGEQLESMGQTDRELIIEPSARNTAPAICAAAIKLEESDPNAIMLVTPSDHYISDEKCFNAAIDKALNIARDGSVAIFGIVPDRAETGYGYIETEKAYETSDDPVAFVKFTEKPDENTAEKMLKSGNYFWNSGMFVFSVETIIEAFKTHAPDIYAIVKQSVTNGQDDLDFFRLDENFKTASEISFDHAIMEKISGYVIPMNCGWNDLGSWATVRLESSKDDKGNAVNGSVTALNCEQSLLRTIGPKTHLVGVGLKNIAAIAMNDAVLVADMDDSQAVSEAVALMRKKSICQADGFPRSARPWGWFETLTKRQRFRVKSIVVKPGKKLSLQSHVHRAEHWVVVEGTAKVTIDDDVKMVTENESVFIPLGAVHRLENPGHMDLHIIEVQTGSYLEEDDITRYEDDFSRV